MGHLQPEPEVKAEEKLVPVRVIILYENLDCSKQAHRTYNYLVESLKGICEFTVQVWKFNLLEDPRLRAVAAADAADAEIVIVSSAGDAELPAGVKGWFDLWLGGKEDHLGLVGLFLYPDRSAVVRDYLEAVAQRGGIDFFAQPGSPSNPARFSPLAFASPGF